MFIELLGYLYWILQLYVYVIIAGAILSWLLVLNVVNYSNPIVRKIWEIVNVLTEPVLKPIRRLMPKTGGIDFSPIVLILLIVFIQSVVLLPLIRSLAIGGVR